jgi:hypothetical protein
MVAVLLIFLTFCVLYAFWRLLEITLDAIQLWQRRRKPAEGKAL